MRLQTFKEKLAKEYNRNRDLQGDIQMMLREDLVSHQSSIKGKLCFLKVNVSNLYDIYSLGNIYVLDYISEVYHNNKYSIKALLKNLITNETKLVSFKQILILDRTLQNYVWFLRAMNNAIGVEEHKDMSKRTFKNFMVETMVGNFNKNLNTSLWSTRFTHLLIIDVSKEYIESLDSRKVEVRTVRNKLKISSLKNGKIKTSHDIIKLTGNLNNINDLTYRNEGQAYPYGDIKTVDGWVSKYIG